jgi:hypothetical protein
MLLQPHLQENPVLLQENTVFTEFTPIVSNEKIPEKIEIVNTPEFEFVEPI